MICAEKAALSSPNIKPVGRPNLRRLRNEDFLKRHSLKRWYSLVDGRKRMNMINANVVKSPATIVATAAPSMPISGAPNLPKMKT